MTIKDVAEHCGVSVSTVSRVLNEHPDVSERVRARVLEAVQQLHYIPNNSARDLVKPQETAIGLIARGVSNPFFAEILPYIERAITQAGYVPVLHQISTAENEVRAGAMLARSKKLRGLIFLGGRFDYTREEVALLDVPFVCCSYSNSFGTLREDAYASVSINDQEQARQATRMLLEQGHRRIAVLLNSAHDHSISELRYRGYCQALEEYGIPVDPELVEEAGEFNMAAAYEGTKRLLARRRDFTAMFTIADSMAVAAMKALHEAGCRVPEDCSVIAIDGIDVSEYTVPTLTTLVQPKREMGEKTVQIMLDLIEQRPCRRHVQLDTALRAGGSVCPRV